jgi:curved DNA-binding protein CbpA
MDPRLRTRIEIETIHELLVDVDHYKLLRIAPEAPQAEIDAAFRNESRRLHPDRHTAGATPEFKVRANDVFKALNESYRILRDPDSRAAYDNGRKETGRTAAEARKLNEAAAAAAKDPSKAARTPKGEKYWKLALQAWQEENYAGCVMNVDFALSFEPGNEIFKEWRGKAKSIADEKKKGREGDTYKIRIG